VERRNRKTLRLRPGSAEGGITGFIASDEDGLVETRPKVGDLSRPAEFDTRFSAALWPRITSLVLRFDRRCSSSIRVSATGINMREPSATGDMVSDPEMQWATASRAS